MRAPSPIAQHARRLTRCADRGLLLFAAAYALAWGVVVWGFVP